MKLTNIYLVVLVSCLRSPYASSLEMTKTRKLLNNVLEANVDTDDPEKNFAYAEDKLRDVLKDLDGHKTSLTLLTLKSEILEFLSMRSLGSDKECGFESYRILSTINRSNGDNAHRILNSLDHLTRVDRVLHRVMDEHARSCRDIHFARFPEAKAKLDKETERRVAANFDSLVGSSYNPLNWPSLAYRDTIMDDFLPSIETLAKEAHDEHSRLLFSLGKKIINVNRDKHRATINRMLQEYFFGPCERYVEIMSPYYDIVLFDNTMKSVSGGRAEDTVKDFRKSKERYLLCLKAIGDNKAKLSDKFWKVIRTSTRSYKKPIPG